MIGRLTLVALLLGIASTADASPRNHDVQATPIYRRAFYSGTSGTKTFATTNLRYDNALGCGAPDTILVVTRPDGTEVMNDNCSSSTKASCVSATGTAGSWMVTVFAQKESTPVTSPGATAFAFPAPTPLTTHCGIADVTVSGVLLDRDVVFGGALVEPGLSGSFRVQTVHTPSGADDTVLLGYGSTWQEVGYDNDSGVGRAAAKTWTLNTASKIVVGSFSPAASGRAALVLNECTGNPDAASPYACRDAGKDRDGDNLSNTLETELGTNLDSFDTDRDGVFDYYEVIGRQLSNGQEQELRRYGALPRRRDLFVEIDREVNQEGNVAPQYTEADIDVKMEDSYLDLPSMPPAPDGTRFIVVHVDVGVACPSRPTLCGDWGGASRVGSTFVEVQAQGYPQFTAVRRGLFQYGYMTTGGSGQAYGSTFYGSYLGALTHEIGHNLGLMHWGDPEQPRLNSKPNYPSLMSYAFQNSLPGVTPDRGRFSEGRLAPMDGFVDEVTYDDEADVRHLSSLWGYNVENGAIDFDRDRRVHGAVLADLAPIGRGTSGLDPWPHMAGAVDLSDLAPGCLGACVPTGGSALATFELGSGVTAIAAFTPRNHQSGMVYPDVAQTFEDDWVGDWGPYAAGVPLDGDVSGEPAAVMFESITQTTNALLLFPHRDGRLHYRVVDLGHPSEGAWTPIPGLPVGTHVRNASVVREGNEVIAIWRDFALTDNESNTFLSRFDLGSQTWGPVELQAIRALATPGMTLAPDGTVYLAVPVATPGYWIQLWHRRPGVAAFTAYSTSMVNWHIPNTTSADLRPRPSLAFVPLRDPAGPFADGSGQLRMWWSGFASNLLHQDDWVLYRAELRGYANATTTSFGSWVEHRDGTGDRPRPGFGVAVAMRGAALVAMYSATTWGAVNGSVDSASRAPRYLPYAFGVAPGYEGLLDHDDAAVIATQMCNALWQLPKGGDAAADCWCAGGVACAVQPEVEVPLCEPE